ncbi:class I SAM-dependent methyltransferase [Jiangella mangrovi]|uniref:Putative O-methyltransferase YrrM n=1 Tax=Jiangella mangrovi TaxID=1524084 RepID=A0A7W9LLQ0_9ACTN|nr:class I SAM-dependent methyltransferase [Jiangella mangrovi]MBB5788443.1 putative O-methyltransferase YrrM [Jiangella mangrovi]
MRLTKQRAAMIVAGIAVVVVGVSAALGWWQVALTIVAAVQVAGVVLLVDIRGRMARSNEVRKVAVSVDRTHRQLGNLGTRMVAAAEKGRVETADGLASIGHALDERRVAEASLQKELSDVAAGVDAHRARVDAQLGDWHGELAAVRSGLAETGQRVSAALDGAERDRRALDKRQAAELARHIRQTEALIQLYERVQPRAAMPSSGGWALDPTGVLTLLEVVRQRRPELVVELGSGTSTLWLGYVLQQLGSGRVVAMDHEERFAELTRAHVAAHGLGDVVEVRVAGLTDPGLPEHETFWYDHAAMADLRDIDLLVVDGPPKATGPMARYPAVPKLADQLRDNAVVALDDATRPDEREVWHRWCKEVDGLDEWAVPPGDALKVLVLNRSAAGESA